MKQPPRLPTVYSLFLWHRDGNKQVARIFTTVEDYEAIMAKFRAGIKEPEVTEAMVYRHISIGDAATSIVARYTINREIILYETESKTAFGQSLEWRESRQGSDAEAHNGA